MLFVNHTNPPGLEGLYTVKTFTNKTGNPATHAWGQAGFEADKGDWSRYVASE
jgi:hypothetical protein